MKKYSYLIASLIICFCVTFAVNSPSAEAGIVTHVNGIMCCNEDLNYPIWSSGSHAGSAIDVSSAYIKREKGSYVYIEALNYIVYYESGEMEPTERDFLMRYHRGTGQIEVYSDHFHKFVSNYSTSKLLQDTFYLIRTKVGI